MIAEAASTELVDIQIRVTVLKEKRQ